MKMKSSVKDCHLRLNDLESFHSIISACLYLQVDEIVNVGSSAGFKSKFPLDDDENIPLKGPSAGSSRMLKMFLTDGRQQVSKSDYTNF